MLGTCEYLVLGGIPIRDVVGPALVIRRKYHLVYLILQSFLDPRDPWYPTLLFYLF